MGRPVLVLAALAALALQVPVGKAEEPLHLRQLKVSAGSSKLYLLDVPGRYQYEENHGYCGECTLQSLMLPYGVWIPQEVGRAAGRGELLPGLNYERAMSNLRIAWTPFTGSGYRQFLQFAKQQLRAGRGVVEVAYLKGEDDPYYDHIMPMIGIQTSTDAYSDADVVYVNTMFSEAAVRRTVGSYWCTAKNKTAGSWQKAGCLPLNYPAGNGYAIKGPAYAGIGPPTKLSGLSSPSEPGLGKTMPITATLTIEGLQAGKKYELYTITSRSGVPASASAQIDAKAWPPATFVAQATRRTQRVTFQSGKPSYYICKASGTQP